MKIYLKENADSTKYIEIPVLPSNFEVGGSANIVTDNINALGQVALYGGTNLFTTTLSSFFPSQRYSFVTSTELLAPYEYIKILKDWMLKGTKIRYIVTDTDVNILCMIETFTYREIDGTRDVYYELNIKEFVKLSTKVSNTIYDINTMGRDNDTSKTTLTYSNILSSNTSVTKEVITHTVISGDTLWGISKKYLGDGDRWQEIYNYNGLKSTVIYAGQRLVVYLD